MSYLKNPYLSVDSENLLIRKNYKVIQSSFKKNLFSNSQPTIQKSSNQKSFKNHQRISSLTTASFSSCPKLKNPFERQILSERSLNIKDCYTNKASLNPQLYFQRQHQKQLPLPSSSNHSYPNRSSSLSNINTLFYKTTTIDNPKNVLQQQKVLSISYRPHFMFPQLSNHGQNTQRWRFETQLLQRQRFQKYGLQGLRYNNGNIPNNGGDLNAEYYTISSSNNIEMINNNSYRGYGGNQRNNIIVKSNNRDERNRIGDYDDDDGVEVMDYSFDENNGGFESKCGDRGDGESRHGPLDLRAFDSDYINKEESFQYIVRHRVGRESSHIYPHQVKIKRAYPQQLLYNGKAFYSIKLVEDRN